MCCVLCCVLSGAPAFGGVRIPGAVAHIEIGADGTAWRSGRVESWTGNIPPLSSKSQPCNKKLLLGGFADDSRSLCLTNLDECNTLFHVIRNDAESPMEEVVTRVLWSPAFTLFLS